MSNSYEQSMYYYEPASTAEYMQNVGIFPAAAAALQVSIPIPQKYDAPAAVFETPSSAGRQWNPPDNPTWSAAVYEADKATEYTYAPQQGSASNPTPVSPYRITMPTEKQRYYEHIYAPTEYLPLTRMTFADPPLTTEERRFHTLAMYQMENYFKKPTVLQTIKPAQSFETVNLNDLWPEL